MYIYINLHAQFCKMSFACVLIYMNIYSNACIDIQEYIEQVTGVPTESDPAPIW